MLLTDNNITMTADEWAQFQVLTNAPWRPRTVAEFNAMCDLGAAWHMAEGTMGSPHLFAHSVQSIKFDSNGQSNFPANPNKMAYIKKYGVSPTPEQLADFIRGDEQQAPATGLRLVVKPGS